MPSAWAPTDGSGRLEGLHGRLGVAVLTCTDTGDPLVELVLAAEQTAAGHSHVVEHDLGGVARADAVLLVLHGHAQAVGAGRDDEAGMALRPNSGSTTPTTTWMSAMPPLVIHALVPLSTHSSLASSYLALVR